MTFTTPPSGSKRARVITEMDYEDWPRSTRRKVSRPNYEESDDDGDNINVGSGALLGEVGSEGNPDGEIRCVCGDNVDDEERAWIGCDSCGVWQHMTCVGLSDDEEDLPERYLCERCGPYGRQGAAILALNQSQLAVRSKEKNQPQSAVERAKAQMLNHVRNSKQNGRSKSQKRVSFSSDAKSASPSESEDAFEPNDDDEASESEEEEEEEEEEEVEDYVDELEDDDDSTLFPSTPTPSNNINGRQHKIAPTPRPPGVTDLGESLINKWIAGELAADIDAINRANDAESDASDIDIPDMSDGDLLAKLAEQDQLIFSLKAKLEQRGKRVAKLKMDLLRLEEENAVLKGMGMVEV